MDPLNPVVALDAVSKSFGATAVLDGITATVREGEFVAVIGPSGSGKSTLFNILAGLETPTAGSVSVAGRCAYMPQKDLLFPWRTVLENTALGLEVAGMRPRAARARARELFAVFGLAGFENARPDQLSGGMRQRAAMLRTVVQEREVLLLDEPFGALDSLTRTDMQAWVQQLWLEPDRHVARTAVMITHDIREAIFLADRVLVLSPRPARIVADLAVGLERPRELDTLTAPQFVALEHELIEVLHRHR